MYTNETRSYCIDRGIHVQVHGAEEGATMESRMFASHRRRVDPRHIRSRSFSRRVFLTRGAPPRNRQVDRGKRWAKRNKNNIIYRWMYMYIINNNLFHLRGTLSTHAAQVLVMYITLYYIILSSVRRRPTRSRAGCIDTAGISKFWTSWETSINNEYTGHGGRGVGPYSNQVPRVYNRHF